VTKQNLSGGGGWKQIAMIRCLLHSISKHTPPRKNYLVDLDIDLESLLNNLKKEKRKKETTVSRHNVAKLFSLSYPNK
jgi:hypothetical protein